MRAVRRIGLVLGAAALFACSGSGSRNGFSANGSDPTPTGPGPGGGTLAPGNAEAGAPILGCAPNSGNYDIPGNNCDDDADGTIDNPPSCDTGLAAGGSAEEFAKAIGLCNKASDAAGWGLVSAKYTRGYQVEDAPHDEQHGVLPKFGDVIKPREGTMLGVLSNGYAQEFDGAAATPFTPGKDWTQIPGTGGTAPPGFPKQAGGCPGSPFANDLINVKLEIKAPRNANGVKFDFNFYSSEWPVFICSPFNDSFVAFLSAKGFNNGTPDNMSFDAKNNPVSVNNGFFDRCAPGVQTSCSGGPFGTPVISVCPGGPAELGGTGYGIVGNGCEPFSKVPQGGATGWLTSQAPIEPGETFTLEFMIWDTGDAQLDSSVLIDNFSWTEQAVPAETKRPN